MALNIEDVYRQLVVLLLKGPRFEETEKKDPIYARSAKILGQFGFTPKSSPINGVSLTLEDNGELGVCIFLEKEVEGLSGFLMKEMNIEKFPIHQLVIGRTRITGRPAVGGESLGEGRYRGQSGTFGCLVEDAAGSKSILTCNHVVSEVNKGIIGSDVIWQPSHGDGGTGADKIGMLHDFSKIAFGGIVPNQIDAALAVPDSQGDVAGGIMSLGTINGTASKVSYRTSVEKYGWKTKKTDGHFLYLTSFIQNYPGHGDALFVDQLGIVGSMGAFSNDGDSGSLVINSHHEAVGLIFADSPDTGITFANPISQVFNYFGVAPV